MPYRVVLTVKESRGNCPYYKAGDKITFEQPEIVKGVNLQEKFHFAYSGVAHFNRKTEVKPFDYGVWLLSETKPKLFFPHYIGGIADAVRDLARAYVKSDILLFLPFFILPLFFSFILPRDDEEARAYSPSRGALWLRIQALLNRANVLQWTAHPRGTC